MRGRREAGGDEGRVIIAAGISKRRPVMSFPTVGSERRDWNDGEQERLEEVFEKVWDGVSAQVKYEVALSTSTSKEAVFTVDGKHRLFVRPERFTCRRETIGEDRTIERDGFGIYVEQRTRGSRTVPPHLEEYRQEGVVGVGTVARRIAVLPLTIRAESAVETWQYAQMLWAEKEVGGSEGEGAF
jgi:hypothetical protein